MSISDLTGGGGILQKCILSLNIGNEDVFQFQVSGGSEFQSFEPMVETAILPNDERTSSSSSSSFILKTSTFPR